ncbi:HAD-IA family hydrolase [Bacillus sp. FJAT-49711]|uniref:HAD family hydrolase n=1 Tax=Bacillus sp. FJAT-49711 TaxID=2833585 RepID=UPI001BC8E4D8|nr:HAD-IA family hydrolase [Bacillus sp. FJAT-49711]MBS4218819.1 HAD-IA family hydrolase [Bacillus sp. FJAT-49711]
MKSEDKFDLVLDIAGVLATNFSPLFWRELSIEYSISYSDLIAFKKEIRDELWTGKITENEFWHRLRKKFPTIEMEGAKIKLLSCIKPLPAIEQIPLLSEYVNIHLLSNHRREWIEHIISPVNHYLKSIIISSDVGCCKPQAEIYLIANTYVSHDHVLFVDDQEKNLKEAHNIGWNTLLADEKGEWMNSLSTFVKNSSEIRRRDDYESTTFRF